MKRKTLALLLGGAAVGAACAIGTIAACVYAYKYAVKTGTEEDHDLLDEQNMELPDTATCYYAEHGNVYHLDKNCPHIANHDHVIVSTVAGAAAAGKLRQCTLCGE